MWIMTNYGILMPSALPKTHRVPGHPEWDMQVRGRDRDAIKKLRSRMANVGLVTSGIVATPDMDYEYRIYCQASDFAHFMAGEIERIDYDKFKPTTLRKGGGGEALHQLYNALWFHIARFYDSKAVAPLRPQKRGGRMLFLNGGSKTA